MPLDIAHPSNAETLDRRFDGFGCSFVMSVEDNGQARFIFRFNTLPPSKAASATADLIEQKFATDEKFRRDVFVLLSAEGRLFKRAADPIPDPPLDANWTMLGDAAGSVVGRLAERFCRAGHGAESLASPTLASPTLASNR